MMTRWHFVHRLIILAVSMSVAAGCSDSSGSPLIGSPADEGPPTESQRDIAGQWKEVDRLVSEDKFEAASRLAGDRP